MIGCLVTNGHTAGNIFLGSDIKVSVGYRSGL